MFKHGNVIQLQSVGSGKNLRILGLDGRVDGNGGNGPFVKFIVHHVSPNVIKLESQKFRGKFLRISKDGVMNGGGVGGGWCRLVVHHHPNGTVSLESKNFSNWHVGILGNGNVRPATNTGRGKFGRFRPIMISQEQKVHHHHPPHHHHHPPPTVHTTVEVNIPTNALGCRMVIGKLKQISVGSKSCVVGVNAGSHVHKRGFLLVLPTWKKQPGSLKQVSAGADGEIWGVGTNDKIFRWDGKKWTAIPGSLTQICVGSKHHIWGVTKSAEIYKYQGNNTWLQVTGTLTNITCNSKGHVYGVDANKLCWQWTGMSWKQLPGTCDWLDVDHDGVLRGFYQGQCFELMGTNWVNITSKFPLNPIYFSFSDSKTCAVITRGDDIWLSSSIM